MDDQEETIIDLSKHSVSEACYWLLQALRSSEFSHLAYTIPFCSYVLSWDRAVPLQAILIMQSPYPNDIFPPIAAAMSYDTGLCKKHMKGRSMPPTVQVLVNDLYINGGLEKEHSVNILKNGWALVDKGILMVNEAVFYTYQREESYIEAAKQCAVLIRLLQETEKHGKRTVNIYAFGEVGEKMGSNLCSWYKSSIVTLTKRKVTHPAGVARRFEDLDSPECHMGTPSFSKSLAKCFRNHVAFMHTMAKKSEVDIKYQRQQDILKGIYNHFPKVADSLKTVFELNKQAMESSSTSQEHKDLMKRLDPAVDDLIARLRITTSLVNTSQSYEGSVSGSVSKQAPSSMKSQAPSESLLSRHIGQNPEPVDQLPARPAGLIKPAKPRKVSTPAETSSFTDIPAPSSVASFDSEPSGIKIKPAKPRSSTPLSTPARRVSAQPESAQSTPNSYKDANQDPEKIDTLSPLTEKFKRNMRIPQSKSNVATPSKSNTSTPIKSSSDPFADKKLSKDQIHQLSCVEQVVISQKGDLDEDNEDHEDSVRYIADIQNDIKNKTIYNGITERLVAAINKDITEDPKFNFINWALDPSKPSATFELCKEEFEF